MTERRRCASRSENAIRGASVAGNTASDPARKGIGVVVEWGRRFATETRSITLDG
jgi:hypothetical protein